MTQSYGPADVAADDLRPPPRPPLNGHRLLGAVPIDPDRPDINLIVLIDRGPTVLDRYVTAWVQSTSDEAWVSGNYHRYYAAALDDLARRAGSLEQLRHRVDDVRRRATR
jgi:hypothetical protein